MVKKKTEVTDEALKIIEQLEKKHGVGKPLKESLSVVSTGSVKLDQATGIGGTALGKMYEIYGQESSGKSTITLHQIAEYQKAFPERKVALIDYENSFDVKYATAIGVDIEKLLLYQPESQEAGYNLVIDLIKSRLLSLVVIDSQTAAAPKAIIDGDMLDQTISLQARNNSKFCLKVKGLLTMYMTSLIWVSQTRSSIGGYGDGNVTTGGNAIKFYSDMRMKVWKMLDKDHDLNKTTIDVIKNKLASPFGQAKINILWGVGFDTFGELIDLAVEFDIVNRAGSWYSYDETKIGQGLERTKQTLLDNPELHEEITEKVMNKLYPPSTVEEIINETD